METHVTIFKGACANVPARHTHLEKNWIVLCIFNSFFCNFCGDKSPFCGATGTLCFGLQLTLPMGFKARVDAPPSVLDVACT